MATYFSNVIAGLTTITDEEGTDLPSLGAAKEEALKDARALMSHAVLQGRDMGSFAASPGFSCSPLLIRALATVSLLHAWLQPDDFAATLRSVGALAGVPAFAALLPLPSRRALSSGIPERWSSRPPLRQGSPAYRYLNDSAATARKSRHPLINSTRRGRKSLGEKTRL
jgi:hypothetical protein